MTHESPLRTETIAPPQQRGVEIGWFPSVEAHISIWFNGRHLKDVSKWTNPEIAVEKAAGITKYYGIEPGCGLVIAVTCTLSEQVKVRRGDYGWEWPSGGGNLPRSVIKAQRLVWTSDYGFTPLPDEQKIPVRLRFRRRFAITGKRADEQDLTSLFCVAFDPLNDLAMIAGLSHDGLMASGLSIQNVGPDPKVSGVFWAEAVGEICVLVDRNLVLEGQGWGDVRNGAMADFCADHLRVSCYPIENYTHWADHATGSVEICWEVISITKLEEQE